jgi:hypothetical protein
MVFQVFDIDNAAMTELLNVHFDHNFDFDFCRRQILNYLKDFSIGTLSSPSYDDDGDGDVRTNDCAVINKTDDGSLISAKAPPISKYVSHKNFFLCLVSRSNIIITIVSIIIIKFLFTISFDILGF